MSAGDRLRTLEDQVGRQKRPRKRLKRSYDTVGPIALSYDTEQHGRALPSAPASAWPAAAAPASFALPAPRDQWAQPPTLESARPPRLARRPAQAWSTVETPPASTAPPAALVRQPHFTESDDEAAAASFSADLVGLPSGEGESVLPTAADAGDFLSRATAVAPRPLTSQPAAAGPPSDDAADEEEPPERWRHGHDVFDRMTSYANQFDLGPVAVDLSRAFDAFDRTLDAQLGATQTSAPGPMGRDLAHDIDLIRNEIAESTQQATEKQSFSVVFDVPLVPQQTGYSCWAAGAAMLVAWRDKMSIDPSAIAAATGYWQQYQEGLQAEDTTMFKAWGLVPEPPQTYTVERFRNLIERFGPLWVASAEPGPHIRVVRGIEGDGSATGTQLQILDPWEPGMSEFRLPNAGGSYTETYEQFEAKQASLARTESNVQGVYVAHLAQERPR
jgi:hypothetical protein